MTPSDRTASRESDQAALIRATAWLMGVILLVTCVLPLSGLGLFLWLLGPALGDAGTTAGRYLQLVTSGQDSEAYRLLCDDAHQDWTPETFTALMDAGPRPIGHTITSTADGPETSTATVGVRLTERGGGTREISLRLVAVDSTPWAVCGPALI
jgi:hypothetical protein